MKRVAPVLLALVLVLVLGSGVLGAEYVGPKTCEMCHRDIASKVTSSVHGSFALDAAVNPKVVPGNFEGNWSKVLGFRKEDVTFVLLPLPGFLETSELVGQKGTFGVPADDYPVLWASVKLRENEWVIEGEAAGEGTPWLTVCAGCHVSGIKVPTKDNPTQARGFHSVGINCENCHGPGSEHVKDPMGVKLIASTEASTCGQCHQRGDSVAKQPNGKPYGYPLSADGRQFQPGDDLATYYRTANTKEDPKLFWPTGHARNSHHLQYPEWLMSVHAKALPDLLQSGHANDGCLKCHSTDAIVKPGTTLKDAKVSLTCQACHDSHDPTQLRVEAKDLCGSCHNGEGSFVPGKAVHHPTKEMFEGNAVPGWKVIPSKHSEAGVTCQACHMPKVTDNPDKGSHLMKVVTPQDGLKYNMPDSCTSCHKVSKEYMGKELEAVQKAVEAQLAAVKAQLDAKQAKFGKDKAYLEAKLGYDVVVADGTHGFHNPAYAMYLLKTAEDKLTALK